MDNQRKKLNWAILGAGVVANEMAQAFSNFGKNIYSVGNRTQSKAIGFAKAYGIDKVYNDFREMFCDPMVDIIYITTPMSTHYEFMKEALSNGKNVLCEKSITLNSSELNELKVIASENNVILAEAMTIYHMPLFAELLKIQKEKLGGVNLIQLNFGSFKEYDMANRFFNMELAGGALLDIGVYSISLARMFMSSCPDKIISQVQYAPSGADEKSGIILANKDGEMAVISLTLHSKQPKRAIISCDNGYIEIMEYPRADEATITYTNGGHSEKICVGSRTNALGYEMKDMEAAIAGNTDKTFINYSSDVMKIMTDIRKDWNMTYPNERTNVYC